MTYSGYQSVITATAVQLLGFAHVRLYWYNGPYNINLLPCSMKEFYFLHVILEEYVID